MEFIHSQFSRCLSWDEWIHNPIGNGYGSSASSSHFSSLAAAAIEAAAFAPQDDAVGWAPKEYNPDDKQSNGKQDQSVDLKDASAPQAGFVWDEAYGYYYYDASSGFYYDGNIGRMCTG